MATLTEIRAANACLTADSIPKTAVFVGATDGIGKASLTELVSTGFPLKIYLVGRSEAAHQPLLAELRTRNDKADIVYLEGQVSLMSDAKRLADEIKKREETLDLLHLSAGILPFAGSQRTEEGLELSMALALYSRLVFISCLLPHLRVAAGGGPGKYAPRIVNIFGPGKESEDLLFDDLGLLHPDSLNVANFLTHTSTIALVVMMRLAAKQGGSVAFVNAHPGWVNTALLQKSWGAQWDPSKGEVKFPGFEQRTPKEAGERSLFLVTSGDYSDKNGVVVSVNHQMEVLQQNELLSNLKKSGAADKIWQHVRDTVGVYLE